MFAWTFSKLKRFAGTNCFLSFYQPDCLFVFVEKMSVVFLSVLVFGSSHHGAL